MRLTLMCLLLVIAVVSTAAAQPNLTAVTFAGARDDGTVEPAERWNTIAPHPAWDVYLAPGAIPGGDTLNNTAGDRSISVPLSPGEHTFTFAVSHQPDDQAGDLGFPFYGLNLFINGAGDGGGDNGNSEHPQLSSFVAADRDGPGGEPDHMANTALSTMGMPLDCPAPGCAGAGLSWTDGSYTVELTDYFVYSKFDAAGAHNDPDFDVMSTGSNPGPFVVDGNQDVVGQFTVNVVPEPTSATLLGLSSLALLGFRRRR